MTWVLSTSGLHDMSHGAACTPALRERSAHRIWAQHPHRDRHERAVFRDFFDGALASGSAFVVHDAKDDRVIGSTRFHAYDPVRGEVEIGWTFLARSHWGGRYNGEMKALLLDHAFAGVERVVFFVGEHNGRSRRAVERIGAVCVKDRPDPSDPVHVVYEMTSERWRSRRLTLGDANRDRAGSPSGAR